MDFQQVLKSMHESADQAKQILLSYYGRLSKVREKTNEGLVSEADLESEKAIAAVLNRDFPGIPMLGEEGASTGAWKVEETSWIVDPLDGTTNYVHSFPFFCISIGLQYQGRLKVGVIDVPMLNTRFWAVDGAGAFCDGKLIQVSRRAHLRESLLATGFYPNAQVDEQVEMFRNLLPECRGIRRAGSAAYDLCMVAAGVFDGFWERNLKPWDTAAGTLLVREAGGVVLNYQAGEYKVTDHGIIAANPILMNEFVSRLKVQS